jgi:plasmid stability protein
MLEGLTPPNRFKGSCKVATVAASLSDEDRTILFDAIESTESWPIKTLARALSERGLQISESPLTNHRAKACVCYR